MLKYKSVIAVLLSGLFVIGLSACEKEGTAEKAGKAIDEAASEVADETRDAVDTLEKKMEE